MTTPRVQDCCNQIAHLEERVAAQGRDLDAAWVDIKQLRERLDDMLKKSLDAIPAKAAILLTLLLGIANILIAVFHK